MKKILIVLGMLILISGCTKKEDDNMLDNILKENNYIIVDVRTKNEFDKGHVKNALNIPYDEIDENTELDKDKTILVYCQSGKRSSVAYNTLTSMGYEVYDLGAYQSITLDKE